MTKCGHNGILDKEKAKDLKFYSKEMHSAAFVLPPFLKKKLDAARESLAEDNLGSLDEAATTASSPVDICSKKRKVNAVHPADPLI